MVEGVGGLVPRAAVAHGVRSEGEIVVIVKFYSLGQRIPSAESVVVEVFVGLDAGVVSEVIVAVVVSCEHAVPCLACLFEVADVLV